jgi:hypothetical protein
MSYANRAIEGLRENGFSVEVGLYMMPLAGYARAMIHPKKSDFGYRSIEDPLHITKILQKDELIPENVGDLAGVEKVDLTIAKDGKVLGGCIVHPNNRLSRVVLPADALDILQNAGYEWKSED